MHLVKILNTFFILFFHFFIFINFLCLFIIIIIFLFIFLNTNVVYNCPATGMQNGD